MRFFLFTSSLLMASCALTSSVYAEDLDSQSGPTVERRIEKGVAPLAPPEQQIDSLFSKLRVERDATAARFIVEQIQQQFLVSGSATVDMLMENAAKAAEEKRYGAALDFLDQVTLLDPTFAEGWNRRATLHFLMGNFAKSMADVAHVLALEPRHIGALAGLAGILEEIGRDGQALKAWEQYLTFYPADRDAQKHVIDLMNKLDGQRT